MPDEAPKKSNRGGKRPGAGRKKASHKSPTVLADIDLTAALAAPVPTDIESVTQPKSRAIVEQLVKLMIHGKSDSARVNACNALLDRGYGKPSTDAAGFAQLPLFGPGISAALASDIRDLARKYATLAVEVLHTIAIHGESEAARVSASKSLLDRSAGSVSTAKLPEGIAARPLGKKEEAQVNAERAAAGKYATPAPPRAVSQTLQ